MCEVTAFMNMSAEARRSPAVQVAIEQLRYWVPTIKDVARVYEGKDEENWLLSIEPHVITACPVALALKGDGRFDIAIANQTYDDRRLATLDHLVVLLERIAQGQVIQRHWTSKATGVRRGIETLVLMDAGSVWRDGIEPDGGSERRDRHFLPYRRV